MMLNLFSARLLQLDLGGRIECLHQEEGAHLRQEVQLAVFGQPTADAPLCETAWDIQLVKFYSEKRFALE